MKLQTLLAAIAFATAPLSALATPVYTTGGSIFIDSSSSPDIFGDFFDDGADGLDISVTGSLIGGTLMADLFVSDGSGTLLSSSSVLSSVFDIIAPNNGVATADTATIVFDTLSGSATALFGSTATLVITFFQEDETGGFIDTATAEVFSDLAPIPLPATLPLLGGAVLGAFALSRRRRA